MLNRCSHCSALMHDAAPSCMRCGLARRQPPLCAVAEPRERCLATVVFCDLGGYTAWNEEAEPEEVAAVMDRIKHYALETFEAHGGVVNQFIGDEVLGLFGVASTHEDDTSRAVLAALSLHAFVRAQQLFRANGEPRRLLMHSGIESGLVYARVHDPRSGLWDVTGDTVNTAARLRSLARGDEILVGAHAQRAIAPYFDTEALPPANVRGKAAPVVPHRVLRAASAPWRFDAARARGLTRYVGRSEQLAILHEALDAAHAGRGATIAIDGPAGSGKTRLMYEFRKQATQRSQRVLWVAHGRCLGPGQPPYQPIIHALLGRARFRDQAGARVLARFRRLGLASERGLSALTSLLAPERAPSLSQEAAQGDVMGDALIELLTRVAAQRTLLLLLEDWDMADERSRAVLERVVEASRSLRVLVVINRALPRLAPLEKLALTPIDASSTRVMAEDALSASPLPEGLVSFLHERAQGNPLFVEELCRSLLASGVLERRANSLRLTRPLALHTPSLEAAMRARIEGLPPRHKALLRLASVIGRDFALELLAHMHGDGHEAEALLLALEAQGFVYRASTEPLSYRFKHALTHRLSYESMLRDDRRWLHGEVARALEQGGAAGREELLAHHYGLSADQGRASSYAAQAAARARALFGCVASDSSLGRANELRELPASPARDAP